ncbi:MAG TPA: MFS transporter [Thermomicrobiales bacterium]|nr:MFS transporter [Thermomicrobiales bacterium]
MDDGHGTGGGRGWRPARLATIGVFLVAGLSFGSWVARIPEVQDALGLDDAQLGLTLLGTAIGSIAAMTGSGVLIARFGSRAVTTAAALGVCVTLPLLPLAPSMPLLFAALLLFGAAYGTMDVAMNAQAVLVEERYGRPIMSSFHGVFSLGGLLGAASAGLVVGAGVAPVPHLLAVGLALALRVAASAWRLIPAASERRDDGPSFALPTGPLLGLGAIGFGALLAEGAIADWGAVYLRDVAGAGAAVAATGYTAFSLTMMVGRFLGDALTERLGPVPMVRGGGLLVAAGLAFALLLGNAAAALVGFALVGAGLAATFPIVLSAAGRVPGVPAGTALAAVATAGYSGFLVGPPTIGFLSGGIEAIGFAGFGLRGALAVVALLGLAVAVLAGQAGRAPQGSERAEPASTRRPEAEAVAEL